MQLLKKNNGIFRDGFRKNMIFQVAQRRAVWEPMIRQSA